MLSCFAIEFFNRILQLNSSNYLNLRITSNISLPKCVHFYRRSRFYRYSKSGESPNIKVETRELKQLFKRTHFLCMSGMSSQKKNYLNDFMPLYAKKKLRMNSINNMVKSLNKYLIIGKNKMNYADVENTVDDNFGMVTIVWFQPSHIYYHIFQI